MPRPTEPLLPSIRTPEEFSRSPRDEATYRPAVAAICHRHGLPAVRLAKYAGGSTIVFSVDHRYVVKLFEPLFAGAAGTERAVLAHVHGRLGVPTPGIVAAGELERWSYVVMDRLPGESLGDAWPELSAGDRATVCEAMGRAVGRLHALPTESLGLPGPAWPDFLRRQAAKCVERQRAHGLAEHWLEQIPGFLASVELPREEPVLLHTEVMRDHTLVRRNASGWEVSGVFDFEPAMLGAREYEFASVGIFLTGGDPALFRAFLRGYGYGDADPDPDFPRRVMAYALLHRYSILTWYLDTVPPRSAASLDALAGEWFGFDVASGESSR